MRATGVRTIAMGAIAVMLAAGTALADPYGRSETLPPSAPAGLIVTIGATASAPTGIAFSPDGTRMYVTSVSGDLLAYPMVAGVAGPPTVFASGFGQALGVVASDDAVFVSGLVRGAGTVFRVRDTDGDLLADESTVVIGGLPNGRHNTNGLAIGSDGLLYIANGNRTDSGFGAEGGSPEIKPYSGSVLRVDPAGTDLALDPSMVVATGFRNIFDVQQIPAGHPAEPSSGLGFAVPTNGPDGQTYGGIQRPNGEDVLAMFDAGDATVDHFAFPWCLHNRNNGGLDGFLQDPVRHPTPSGDCTTLPAAAYTGLDPSATVVGKPAGLFGMHVSADGMAFNPGGSLPAEYANDLFVTEFGNFFGDTPAGHKVVRVRFDADGSVASIEDFMTASAPLDLTFAPDGTLWIADLGGAIIRVAGLPV